MNYKMNYIIESVSLKDFVKDNGKYMLPRYQRRKRWNSNDNFELAISIFQDYPIGVVILDERDGECWLLDGRQRRNALEKMVNDPTGLYWWARDYIDFDDQTLESDVSNAFWLKIDRFIKKDNEKQLEDESGRETDTDDTDDDDDDYEVNEEEPKYEAEDDGIINEKEGIRDESQRERLKVLLNLVLMVHKLRPRSEEDRWEKIFDFKNEESGMMNPGYFPEDGIDIPTLKDFLIKYSNSRKGKDLSEETFREYCEVQFKARGNKKLESAIRDRWEMIKFSITTIKAADDIFEEIRIGAIRLLSLSFLDSLNIFSRVNSKGVQLKVEELLSANPFWNEPVENVDYRVGQAIDTMYDRLGITRLKNFVRWDIVATLIPRLNDQLVLKQSGEEVGDFLGFKLLSSIYVNGMTKRHLADLEGKEKEIFGNDNKIPELVNDLRILLDILQRDDLLRHYTRGRKTLIELLGHAPALEFITVLFNSWKAKGKPRYKKDNEAVMDIQKEARILFDKLIFEWMNDDWKAAGDSKMARHITAWKSRLEEPPVAYSDWRTKILFWCEEKKTTQSLSAKKLAPVLYYFEALRGEKGFWPDDRHADEFYDIDHIFPQKKLRNKNLNLKGYNKDCLANLALLPQHSNKEKGRKGLSELDSGLAGVVARSAGTADGALRTEDFKGKYSDLEGGFEALVKDRRDNLFLKLLNKRQKLLGLPEVVEGSEPQAGSTNS